MLPFAGRHQQFAADLGEDTADVDLEHVRHGPAHPRPHVVQRIRRRTFAPPGEDRRNVEASFGGRQGQQVDQQTGVPGNVVGGIVVVVINVNVDVEGRTGTNAAEPARTLRDYQVLRRYSRPSQVPRYL